MARVINALFWFGVWLAIVFASPLIAGCGEAKVGQAPTCSANRRAGRVNGRLHAQPITLDARRQFPIRSGG
jgi:hypothetical protein